MHTWHCRNHRFTFPSSALVLGIVNITPDSFSDGGKFQAIDHAIEQAMRLVAEGADILDIGGESTRPGAVPVSTMDELARVLPVVRELSRSTTVPVSIDTTKSVVARACLDAGASIINDISGMTWDAEMPAVIRDFGAGVILMHIQGTPQTMQIAPTYSDVMAEVAAFLEARLQSLAGMGIPHESIALDPGIGFGKSFEHNITLLQQLPKLQRLGRPVCLGVSRKGFIGTITTRPVNERLAGSLAVLCHALASDAVQIARVHDVGPTVDAVRIFSALRAQVVRPTPSG